MMSKDFLTTAQVGKVLGVHHATVRRWIDCGELKASRTLGGHRRVTRQALLDFVRQHDMPLSQEVDWPDSSTARSRSQGVRDVSMAGDPAVLQTIVASMADIVFVLDADTRFTYYHAPCDSGLYLPPDQFLGRRHSEVMPPPLNKPFCRAIEENRHGRVSECEYDLPVNGTQESWHVVLSPILRNGTYQGSVAVMRDMGK